MVCPTDGKASKVAVTETLDLSFEYIYYCTFFYFIGSARVCRKYLVVVCTLLALSTYSSSHRSSFPQGHRSFWDWLSEQAE